jgi:DNA-binding response OmpR family regulator
MKADDEDAVKDPGPLIETSFEILLIEDNPGDVQLVTYVLAHRKDIHISVVENTVQAFQFLQRRERFSWAPVPDLILLDLNLPIFSGKALLDERRRQTNWKKIPVVVFTSSRNHRAECFALGANEYVTKPCDWDEWNTTLQAVLGRYLTPQSI